jgi:catechol 2,3-dioxygenase-like lactoylglutathione lyase family enzyme
MIERLSHVTVLVRDQDEALGFYRGKLGLEVVEDAKMPSGDRWLTVAPKDGKDVQIVLQKPSTAVFGEDGAREMLNRVGKNSTWAFKVDDCIKTCDELEKKGVKIVSQPVKYPFATEAIFEDLYGNQYILMEPPKPGKNV